ncbi:MAG TPA: Na+/H+ antiporter subunit E [Draconibacterium sp.]|nr:Na+/H+ antiporter subunit E [Draconibacterium sp.]
MLRKIFYILEFIVYYLYQLVRSNFQLAYIILSPNMNIKSGFIDVPLSLNSDIGLLLFSNLVSMTPGSLVTNISENRETATVHVLFSTTDAEIQSEVQRMQEKIKRFTN